MDDGAAVNLRVEQESSFILTPLVDEDGKVLITGQEVKGCVLVLSCHHD